MYRKRWNVERVFNRWKVEGRLNDYRFRQAITTHLHSMFQMLALQTVILTRMKTAHDPSAIWRNWFLCCHLVEMT